MAEFVKTKGTAAHIEDIITGASKRLVLISPYWQISKSFYNRLIDANEKSISIIIIYREGKLEEEERKKLSGLKNVQLRAVKNLHAKCYHNETDMVITSMNMYEHSENNNFEMGIAINSETDKKIFIEALKECDYIFQHSVAESGQTVVTFNKNLKTIQSNSALINHSNNGSCIRCGNEIAFNPDKPYCDKCYKTWNKYGDINYPEEICHGCGNDEDTSMTIPQCAPCYKAWKNGYRNNRRRTG